MTRTSNGHAILSITNKDDGGTLAAGQPADILLLDWDAVDTERLRADLDPRDLRPVDDLQTLRGKFAEPHERLVLLVGRLV